MAEIKLTVSEIKELMDKMAETGLTGLTLKEGDFELSLKTEEKIVEVSAAALQPAPPVVPAESTPSKKQKSEELSGNVVKSPIADTFYSAASPEKPAFVTVGQQVNKGDVLFIIESMKLMNEVQSEYTGTVKKILVKNGQGVEYGQPILMIE